MIELLYFLAFMSVLFSLGRRLLRLFRLRIDFMEEVIFGMCLGYFIIGYITFFLGMFGLIYKPIFLTLFLVGIFISLFDIKYIMQNIKKMFSDFDFGFNLKSILFILLLFFLIINLIPAMAPPWTWMGISYHLAVPKIYMREHSIVYIPSILHSNFPLFTAMLNLFGLVLYNDIFLELIAYSFNITLILAIISFSKRFFDLKVGLFAALVFFLMPNVMENTTNFASDIANALFCFLAFYAFVFWFNELNLRWLILSSIMMGLALSTKYLAAIAFLILLFFLVIKLIFIKHKKKLYKFISLFLFSIISFLVFAPWLIKNYIYTGNPIYPFFYSLLGGKYLTETTMVYLSTPTFKLNFLNYILLPWNFTMFASKFPGIMSVGPIFLAFIPLLLLFKNKKNVVITLSLIFSFFAITLWFFVGSHYIRYILFAFTFLSIISAFVISELISYKSRVVNFFILIALFSSLVFNSILWMGMNLKVFPVVFGLESKEYFYDKLKDHNLYDASQFINKNSASNSKIFLVNDNRGYFLDRDFVVHNVGVSAYINYSRFSNDEEFFLRLKELNITHMIVNHNFDHDMGVRYTPELKKLFTNLTTKYSKQIYNKKNIEILELK